MGGYSSTPPSSCTPFSPHQLPEDTATAQRTLCPPGWPHIYKVEHTHPCIPTPPWRWAALRSTCACTHVHDTHVHDTHTCTQMHTQLTATSRAGPGLSPQAVSWCPRHVYCASDKPLQQPGCQHWVSLPAPRVSGDLLQQCGRKNTGENGPMPTPTGQPRSPSQQASSGIRKGQWASACEGLRGPQLPTPLLAQPRWQSAAGAHGFVTLSSPEPTASAQGSPKHSPDLHTCPHKPAGSHAPPRVCSTASLPAGVSPHIPHVQGTARWAQRNSVGRPPPTPHPPRVSEAGPQQRWPQT